MMKRRGTPSHYLGGIGDGKVNAALRDPGADMVYLRHPSNQAQDAEIYLKQRPLHENRRKHFEAEDSEIHRAEINRKKNNKREVDSDAWRLYQSSFESVSPRVNAYNHHVQLAQPSAFFLMILLMVAVVFTSTLFLHLISDTTKRESIRPKRRSRRFPIIVKNKKTDEWIDDEEEEPQQIVSSGETQQSPTDAPPRPPAVYYHPYQARLQQRQRLIPSSANSNAINNTSTAPTAAITASGSLPPTPQKQQQVNGEVYPTANYYMLHSGGMPQYRSPGGTNRPHLPSDSHSPVSPQRAADVGLRLGYQRESRVSATQIQLSPAQQQQPYYQLARAVALPAEISSFGSLTEAVTTPQDQVQHDTHLDEETGLSTPSTNLDVESQTPLHCRDKAPIALSPGTEDVHTTTRRRAKKKPDHLLDQTPRVANRQVQQTRQATPQIPFPVAAAASVPSGESLASSEMAFASPPRRLSPKKQQQQQSSDHSHHLSPSGIPYVPNLANHPVDHAVHSDPPKSVNVQELQLYRMESGSVSHWQARVAEESQIIQNRVFSPSSDDSGIVVPPDIIPSDDPRGGIDHKRGDLTMDTDSASSLQGAIDFDKLELIEVIGGGGFGQVWKAKLRGTPVAVKVLTGSAQAKHVPRAVLEEFAAEINLLRGMQHPNICLYMGACVKPPNRAIVTELAANGSLWDALRLPLTPPYTPCDGLSSRGWPDSLFEPDACHGAPPNSENRPRLLHVPPRYTWPWKLVKKVAIGVARGMAYLHSGEPPVLHRDLKSANILLDESYNAKVCDFGLSRLKAHERSMTGNCGTVQWMAPEVLASKPYNEKADIFSYGIICWELLSRQCPYDGMTAIQCALAVLNRNKRPEIPKWCPPPLHALIRSCVKKNPDERPSFEQIIQALDSMPDE